MITLKHKELIAEKVMGWKATGPAMKKSFLPITEWHLAPDPFPLYIKDFDPTGKHFYEILGKLTSEQKEKIKYIMSWRDRDVNPSIWDNHSNPHPIDTALWIESHKEEAITALIEVLEGMK